MAEPDGSYGGAPEKGSGRRTVFRLENVRVDPLADRYFSLKRGADERVAVLIGLKPGIHARVLLQAPRGVDVSAADWRGNLSIAPIYTEYAAADVLGRSGWVTGHATRRFFGWLMAEPAIQDLIESIALSAAPRESKPRPALRKSAKPAMPSAAGLAGAKVVLAVIDDWIGAANYRFRLTNGNTRCLGLWLQGVEGAGAPPPGFTFGRGLKASDINALLAASGTDEEAFERSLFAPGRAMPSRRLSHGTHVADLFAGYGHHPAAETKEGKSRPIIGVALPQVSLRDTSGLPLITPLVNALAYVIQTMMGAGWASPPPVVVNYSNGAMSDIERKQDAARDAVTAMMDAYNTIFPQSPMVMVTAAGNSFQEQGHACVPRVGVPSARRWPLDLRIMPDDRTPSYVTLELPPGAAAYRLEVTAPGLQPKIVDPGQLDAEITDSMGRIVAQLRYDPPPPGLQGIFTLIIEPTADPLDGAADGLAPHGIWRLELSGPGTAKKKAVHSFIARDITLPGSPSFGRQARFEDAAFERTDRIGRPGSTDAPASAIKRGGAINVIGSAFAAGPVSVAARVIRTDRPADYSSAGYPLAPPQPLSIRGPDVITDAEHSEIVAGLLAAGTRTGSIVAMSGTSVAAPVAARALADALATGSPGLPANANAGRILAKLLASGAAVQDARRGFGAIATTGRRNVELIALRDR
jgi:hypothetical protein